MNIDIVDGAPSKRSTLSLHRFCQKLYQDSGRSYVCVTVCHIDNAINLISISSSPPLYLSRRYFWTETICCKKRKQYIELLQPSLISLAPVFRLFWFLVVIARAQPLRTRKRAPVTTQPTASLLLRFTTYELGSMELFEPTICFVHSPIEEKKHPNPVACMACQVSMLQKSMDWNIWPLPDMQKTWKLAPVYFLPLKK